MIRHVIKKIIFITFGKTKKKPFLFYIRSLFTEYRTVLSCFIHIIFVTLHLLWLNILSKTKDIFLKATHYQSSCVWRFSGFTSNAMTICMRICLSLQSRCDNIKKVWFLTVKVWIYIYVFHCNIRKTYVAICVNAERYCMR